MYVGEQWVEKTPYVNEYGDTDYRYALMGESGVYETRYENTGELFRAFKKEAGRCVSRVYHDEHGPIGWVFEKLVDYEDTGEPFLMETWVTVHAAEPTRTVEYHYYGMGKENV